MDEEAQMHEEPERTLKRLRLRNQNDHVSPSFGLGETSSRGPPKVEEADLPETCPEQRSQDMIQSPQPLVRNKGKQPVLPEPVSIQDSFEPSQPGAAYRTEPFATRRIESDLVPPPVRLTGKGKEPLLPQIAAGISVRSPHAVRLKEPMVDTGIVLSPKPHVHDSCVLIKPKDEPFTDDILQAEVPSAVIHGEPLSIENSSSANGSIGASDGPEHIVSQSVDGEARNDGVLASSNERTTNCKLANNVDGSSSNLDIASSHYRELAEAVYEYGKGNYKEALELLGPIGASDEQLDVFNEVWYVMLLNTGQAIKAIEVIGKRIKMREGAPFMWRLLERGYAMVGRPEATTVGEQAKCLETAYFK